MRKDNNMPEDVVQIKIGKHRIGIIGFKTVCEDLAAGYQTMTDSEIKNTLMTKLGEKNYISQNVGQDYETAFFKAFKQFVGEPLADEHDIPGLEIKVLGQGCVRCNQLEKDVMDIVSEMNVQADIEHVSGIKEIAAYGVLGLPGLVINGKVKSAGTIPTKAKIMGWINEAETGHSK